MTVSGREVAGPQAEGVMMSTPTRNHDQAAPGQGLNHREEISVSGAVLSDAPWGAAAVTGVANAGAAKPDTNSATIAAAKTGGVFLSIKTDSSHLPPWPQN